ncbi:MAG: FHA domain protein [Rhodobacteraceae bacterium HLUCCO18]|nr:MAG: FHA domain protein [Rhodobacteraceae bacterium HLUCCO18]
MKRLHDVAVRMRPRVPRAPDGAPQARVDREGSPEREPPLVLERPETGFSTPAEGARIPARSPFVPSSRDLAREAARHAADVSDGPDADVETGAAAGAPASGATKQPIRGGDMTDPKTGAERPVSVPRRQIWDLEPDEIEQVASHTVVTDRTYLPDAGDDHAVADAEPAGGEAGEEDMASRALRALEAAERQLEARGIPASALYEGEGAKTRVLGFHARDLETDAISAVARKSAGDVRFPAGWIVIVDGPGRGAYFAVTNSVSSIGRGLDQSICLNFGDASISRNNHAAIAYDAEQNRFFLGHGNKSNIVRRNGQPVLSTEELMDGDEIRIGKTTLRFVALCGPGFIWGADPEEEGADAS